MKSTKALRDLFREFLGVCNVRDLYVMACVTHGQRLVEFLRKSSPKQFVIHAFNVTNSYEGHDFWGGIDEDWQKYLEAHDIESRRQ